MCQKEIAVKFYCESCEKHSLVNIDPLLIDNLNDDKIAWGDIVCAVKDCHLVIATISTDTPGIYRFVRVAFN